jgi:hypothetical protein
MRLGVEFLHKTSTSEGDCRENRLTESNSLSEGANELLRALSQFVDMSE